MAQAMLDMADLRRDVRVMITYRTTIMPHGAAPTGAVALNLSRFGVLLSCTTPPESGQAILVRLPFAGDVPAEIVWAMGERIGCQFDRPFALDDYHLIVAGLAGAQ